MAFPWEFEENFEAGNKGQFTGGIEEDQLGKIDFPGPQDDLDVPPYLGGYVMRVDLNRGVNNAYVIGDATLNLGTGNTRYARIMLRVSDDTKLPSSLDSVRIFQLLSGSFIEEAAIGLVRSDKGDLMIGIFPRLYGNWIHGIEIQRNEWVALEITIIFSSTAAELRVFANGSQVAAVGMIWPAITQWRLGAIAQTNDVRGTLYFDSVVIDNDRLVAPQMLDPTALDGETITITRSGYAFVGPGEVTCVTLIAMGGTTSDHAVQLYDTDRLPVAHHDQKIALKAAVPESYESKGTKVFKRGCYVVLSGTGAATAHATIAPTAIIQLGTVTEYGWGSMGEEGVAA